MATLNMNILDSYVMMGLWEGLSPVNTFFRDRYFPTGPSDIFKTKKVLVEYKDGDHGMAPFMMPNADPINVNRAGFEIHDYKPTCIKQSRILTVDQLDQLGFGEAILTDKNPEDREAAATSEDLEMLERRFTRTEELLCANTIINNGFSVNELAGLKDDGTEIVGNVATVQYYDPNKGNDGAVTISAGDKLTSSSKYSDLVKIVRPMCRSLSRRGLPSVDLLVGQDVADLLLDLDDVRKLLDKNSGIIIGDPIVAELSKYDGVTLLGQLNVSGYRLNLIVVDEQYGVETVNMGVKTVTYYNYFPAKSICVTAPNAGHLMYGGISRMNEQGKIETIAAKRFPDLFVKREKKMREITLESCPLAAPKNYAPWVYGANAC